MIRRLRECKKLNNVGLSLTELIVVIAIMAVLAGISISLLGLIPRSHVNGCTEHIGGAIEKTKSNAMSFANVALEITQTADGVFIQFKKSDASGNLADDGAKQQVGKAGVEISYVLQGGVETPLDSDKMTISFKRSSGAFEETIVGSTHGACEKIIIRKGSISRTIELVELTGKISY